MKNYSKITENKDILTKEYADSTYAKVNAENTFTAKQTINSGYGTVSLKTQGYVELNASWLNGTLGGLLGLKLDDTSGRVYTVTKNDLGLVSAISINNSTKQPGDTGIVDLGTVITAHQDISGKANLSGGNTFTGKQTLNSPASDGYSINAAGYIKGSWLQAPSTGKASSNTGKVCVLDGSGWVYYRTPAEIVSDGGGATTDQIPTVNNGTLTIQKNGTTVQTFSANQSGNVTANITVPTFSFSNGVLTITT